MKKIDSVVAMMLRPGGASGVELTLLVGYDKGWAAIARQQAKLHGYSFRTEKRGRTVRYYLRKKEKQQ